MVLRGSVSGVEDVPWQVDSWNIEKGLPNNSVTAIAQTQDGFLWIGTDNGLARFDGQNFRSFSPQNTPGVASTRVEALCADDSGGLWIKASGAALGYMRGGQFSRGDSEGGVGSSRVVSLKSEGADLWLANEAGVVARLNGGACYSLSTNVEASDGSLRLFHCKNGGVYAASSRSLEQVTSRGAERMIQVATGKLRFLVPGRRGWWLGSGSSLRLLEGEKSVSEVGFPTNVLSSTRVAHEDRDGNLWIGTEVSGLWCRMTDGTVQAFSSTNGLGADSVACLFEDRQGTIWAGSEGGGLTRLRRRLFHVLPLMEGLSGAAVTTICDGGAEGIWVGTERNGLIRVGNGVIQGVRTAEGHEIRRIRTVTVDSAGRVWSGTQDDGLFYLQDGELKPFKALGAARHISAAFEDDRWGLWIGAETAGQIYRVVGDAPQQFTMPEAPLIMDVRVFANDGTGGLWIGTGGRGLFHWNGRDYRNYTHSAGLGSDTIWSLLVDSSNRCVWVGTAGGGLSRWKDGKVQTCTEREGLHDNVVCQMLDDGAGCLWCSSPHGVFRVSKSELTDYFEGRSATVHSAVFGMGDGLPSLECAGGSQPAGFRGVDGRLWWPTAKGLTWVNPGDLKSDPTPPSVVVDEMVVDDQPVRIRQGSLLPAEIRPGSHRVELRYTALSWLAPDFVKFRVKLEEFDRSWVETGLRRMVHYTGLPPGQYQFQVMAANRDGVWSVPAPGIRLSVQPFFWQTWWFKLCLACALAVSVGLLVTWFLRRRHRARIEGLERMHAVEQERARIAQDIHDDLGASLTEIALLSELAQTQMDQPQAARGHLDSIFTKARSLARATDEIVWALHPKNNSLEPSLNFITRSAQEFLRAAGLRCRLDFPEELPDAPMHSATRHHLYLSVKEALNNVAKHGAATEVWLRLKCGKDSIVLEVEDNGRGFDPGQVQQAEKSASASGRGHGLKNMEQRMRSVGGRFEQESRLGQGTVNRFILPLRS